MFYAEKVDDEGENLMLVLHLINLCLKCNVCMKNSERRVVGGNIMY